MLIASTGQSFSASFAFFFLFIRNYNISKFKTFTDLKPGEKMELVNDHDPRPLHYQFIMEMPEQFEWEYLEQGPEVWRVAIEKK